MKSSKVRFQSQVRRWWGVIMGHARVTLMVALSTVLLPVIPLIIGAPKYVSGGMSLGELMQVAAAFVQSQLALNWIANNFIRTKAEAVRK